MRARRAALGVALIGAAVAAARRTRMGRQLWGAMRSRVTGQGSPDALQDGEFSYVEPWPVAASSPAPAVQDVSEPIAAEEFAYFVEADAGDDGDASYDAQLEAESFEFPPSDPVLDAEPGLPETGDETQELPIGPDAVDELAEHGMSVRDRFSSEP